MPSLAPPLVLRDPGHPRVTAALCVSLVTLACLPRWDSMEDLPDIETPTLDPGRHLGYKLARAVSFGRDPWGSSLGWLPWLGAAT